MRAFLLPMFFVAACSDSTGVTGDDPDLSLSSPDLVVQFEAFDLSSPDLDESDLAGPPTCFDDARNGSETDVDCGGPKCKKCVAGQGCLIGNDCTTLDCLSHACVVPPNRAPSFAPAVVYELPAPGPVDLTVGDFNGDGALDVAVCDADVGIERLAGVGNGTLRAATTTASGGQYPFGIVALDLDLDGRSDVAVANLDSEDVSVLLGTKAGFGAPAIYPIGSAPVLDGITGGDFDGDGRLDVAVTAGSKMAVLFGKGAGKLSSATSFLSSAQKLVAADFNGDGKIDLAQFSLTSTVLLSNANRTFTMSWTSPNPLSGGLSGYGVGLMNGDAIPDLVVASGAQADGLRAYTGDGKGAFTSGAKFANAASTDKIAIADFNRDGWNDVALFAGDQIYIYLGDGAGSFKDVITVPFGVVGGISPDGFAAGDFNNDGRPDLVCAIHHNGDPGRVSVLLNTTK